MQRMNPTQYVLIIVATTSKICSRGPSTRSRPRASALPPCQSTNLQASRCTSPPSILVYPKFDRYVLTRFLADSNFHGHGPTVLTWSSTLLMLCIRSLILLLASLLLADHAYHNLPTGREPLDTPVLHARSTHSEFVDCVHILSTASSYPPAAVLRDISTGTSYQIVRLVFRPYTHFSSAN